MTLLDNTGFSSVFADVRDEDIVFDTMYEAEEDDELMEFVLSDENGVVVEDTNIDASSIEDESPDTNDVEGLAGPEINAKEIENEKCGVKKESDEADKDFDNGVEELEKQNAEDVKEQQLNRAYEAALNSLLSENDEDVKVPNDSKEAPSTVESDPGDTDNMDMDEAFMMQEESWDNTLKNDVDSRGSEEFKMDTTIPQAPIVKPTVPANAEGKGKEEIDAKKIEKEEGTDASFEAAFMDEANLSDEVGFDDGKEDGVEDSDSDILTNNDKVDEEDKINESDDDLEAEEDKEEDSEDTEDEESEGDLEFDSEEDSEDSDDDEEIDLDDIDLEDLEDDDDEDVEFDDDELDEAFNGNENDTLKNDVDARPEGEFKMDTDIPQAPIVKPTVPANAESKGEEEIDAKEIEKESFEDAFLSEEQKFDDTLKNDVDSRGSEEFKMDTTIPQAPIVKPTVPADAEGKNADPDINAKKIEDEEGTDSEFESAFLSEENSWNDTLKNDVESRVNGQGPSMDTVLPQAPIVKPTTPNPVEGKGKEEIDAKKIEDEEGTDPEFESAFMDECWDDTLKNEVDCRGKGCDPVMDVDLPQAPIVKPTVPADAEGKNADPDINAKKIEDEEGTDSSFESAFLSEEVDKSVAANAEEPGEEIEDDLMDAADSSDADDLSDSMMNDLLADDIEDELISDVNEM